MAQRMRLGAYLGALLAIVVLTAVEARATTIAQNSSWTVTRTGATQTLRVVAYGDSIFAGYTGTSSICRRAEPLVTGEYSAALSGQNWIIHRRCQSGAVASGIFSRMTSATDKAFMQDASTRIVMFEMCGNDFLQARSNFKSSTGTCNYSGLDTAASNCRSFTQQAMDFINTTANANTKLKIVMNLHYPGYDADNALSGCTDSTTGQKVNMQDLFIPRLLESNWNTCNYAAQKGFICSDAFAEFMARDYDSNADGQLDSDAIRYIQGESLANYKVRVIALRSTLRDAKFHLINSTTSFNYLQSDDTHPSFEGATASTNLGLTTPTGNVTVLNPTTGAYPDGKNPHWNQNGHDRSGWGINPGGSLTPEKCGNGISNETSWLPSGTAVVEGCDDGNTTAGDGCSSSCTVETGWACSGSPSMCAPICGDNLITGAEQCDDGNTTAGDGCSHTCTVEPGFSCMGHPSTCSAICGDGLIVNGEGCDDHNLANGDGCSSTCHVEEGWHCAGETSVCAPICGDSLIKGTEDCDDGDKNGTMQSCCATSCAFEEHGTSCDDDNACNVDEICDGVSNQCGGGQPANCDDNNPCTTDTCNPSTGCAHTNNTASCDDGNACTQTDTCNLGVCVGSNPVVCSASDQCHTAGVCDQSTGTCSNPNKADDVTCDDGNACTQSDTCQAGVCTGANPVVCTASDQCHDAGTCEPSTGTCSNPNKTNGSGCDDGSACTQSDTCEAGVCTGANPVVCAASDQCHVAGTCDPAHGTCSNPNKTNGSGCDDGNACTQSDTCEAGVCTGANPVVCTASDQCHVAGTCNPANGTCSNPDKSNGSACSDGNACTQSDTCQAGVCSGANPVVCTASDQCHVAGACNPANGTCSDPQKPNGSGCSDGNACTQTDTCQAGVCSGANPVVCTASDQCHVAGTCNSANGTCSDPQKPNGSGCNDGNACSQTDTCQGGSCIGTNPVICTAADQCHVAGTCDPGSGFCSNPNKADGSSCNDGNACTTSDACSAGGCVGGPPPDCSDGNVCTDDLCDPSSGCMNPNNTAPCSDGNTCTAPDVCGGGTCHSGPAVYSFPGFLQPVDNLPTVNIGKAGRTYPVKWQLPLCAGGYVTRLNVVNYNPLRYRQVACDGSAPQDAMESETSGASVLRYDTTAQQYVYNWQTTSTFAGKCYELYVELDNGTTQVARFSFTK